MGMMRGAHNANSVTGNNWIGSITQGDKGINAAVGLYRWITHNVSDMHPCRGGLKIYWGCEMCNSIESEPVTTRSCDNKTRVGANWIRTFVFTAGPVWLWWHWHHNGDPVNRGMRRACTLSGWAPSVSRMGCLTSVITISLLSRVSRQPLTTPSHCPAKQIHYSR